MAVSNVERTLTVLTELLLALVVLLVKLLLLDQHLLITVMTPMVVS